MSFEFTSDPNKCRAMPGMAASQSFLSAGDRRDRSCQLMTPRLRSVISSLRFERPVRPIRVIGPVLHVAQLLEFNLLHVTVDGCNDELIAVARR